MPFSIYSWKTIKQDKSFMNRNAMPCINRKKEKDVSFKWKNRKRR